MLIATDEVVDVPYVTEVDSTRPGPGERRGKDEPCSDDQRAFGQSFIGAKVSPNP